MTIDEQWKEHKATCSACACAMTFDRLCNDGRTLYKARLEDPSMRVKLGKRGRS